MKFLLDENFPRSSVDLITECGHEAILFDEVCEFGNDDETVFAAVQRLGATILTSDRDFYHTVPLFYILFMQGSLLWRSDSQTVQRFIPASGGSWRTSKNHLPIAYSLYETSLTAYENRFDDTAISHVSITAPLAWYVIYCDK